MDGLAKFFMGGNVIAKMLVLQACAAVVVLFLLKKALDRELFLYAMEQLSVFSEKESSEVDEIAVLTAGKLSQDDVSRLTGLVKGRFPRARIMMAQDVSLWGGLVMRVGARTLDGSLSSKIKQLFQAADQ